jgi:HK97 family phage prohead protease
MESIMPIPTPNPNETESDFVSRCMEAMESEYPNAEQRAAVCHSQWRKAKERAATPAEVRLCFQSTEQLRVVEAEGKPTMIAGMVVPYNQPSEDLGGFREIIKPGAFTAALEGTGDMRADVEHDRSKLLGRRKNGRLVFDDQADALYATIMPPNTQLGKDTLEEVRTGQRDAMSVSYATAGCEAHFRRQDGELIREVTKAKRTGVALTAFPVFTQTADTVSLRAFLDDEEAQKTEATQVAEQERAQIASSNVKRRLDLELARDNLDLPPQVR